MPSAQVFCSWSQSPALPSCTRDVTCQVIALSFYGTLMALVFFFFQAPDVALSQITVGMVALPLMVMLAISRMKFRDRVKSQNSGGGDSHDCCQCHQL